MNGHNDRDRFEEAWREWAKRPPRVSPECAAGKVHAAIESAPRRRWGTRTVLAAAAVALVAVLVGVVLRNGPHTEPPAFRPEAGGSVVVMWLDPGTPLYMNLEPLKIDKGDPS